MAAFVQLLSMIQFKNCKQAKKQWKSVLKILISQVTLVDVDWFIYLSAAQSA